MLVTSGSKWDDKGREGKRTENKKDKRGETPQSQEELEAMKRNRRDPKLPVKYQDYVVSDANKYEEDEIRDAKKTRNAEGSNTTILNNLFTTPRERW